MQNPRFFFRVDGEIPDTHPLLGYRMPFDYESINRFVDKFTTGVQWKTIQIKIIPSLTTDRTKVIILSDEFKHLDAPAEHGVILLDSKSKDLLYSAETLEELFNTIEGKS